MIDLKLVARRHRRAIAITVAATLLVPAAAFSAAGQGQVALRLQQQEELLQQSVVTDVSEAEQLVRVDVAQNPAAADIWLDKSAEVLDGWTVVVDGMESRPGKERAALDAEAVAGDPAPAAQECPDLPEGPRSTDGATTPYLGCGPNEGVHATARTVQGGSSATTLATAVDAVLASYLPGAALPPTKAEISKGEATVDIAAGFERALAGADVDPGEVWQALLFTAHSNGSINSVRFTLGGDCLAFAYATGGDMCASTDLPVELG